MTAKRSSMRADDSNLGNAEMSSRSMQCSMRSFSQSSISLLPIELNGSEFAVVTPAVGYLSMIAAAVTVTGAICGTAEISRRCGDFERKPLRPMGEVRGNKPISAFLAAGWHASAQNTAPSQTARNLSASALFPISWHPKIRNGIEKNKSVVAKPSRFFRLAGISRQRNALAVGLAAWFQLFDGKCRKCDQY